MRNNSVTIAKAIAIILMVLGHAKIPDMMNGFLSLMRMPLFFIMCGICFKEKYLTTESEYIKKRFTGIYIPYVKWSLFFLLFHNVFFHFNLINEFYGFNGKVSFLYDVKEYLSRLLHIVTRMTGHEQLLGGFWFLKSLFLGSIIFFYTKKVISNALVGCLVLMSITLLLSFLNLRAPYFLIDSKDFLASFFIMFGHWYKYKNFKCETKIWFIIVSILILILGTFYWRTSMTKVQTWQIIPYAVSAICGTLVIYGLSHYLETKKGNIISFLIFTGGYTFNVLTWHFLCFKLVSLIIIYIYGLPFTRLAEFPVIVEYAEKGWWAAYFSFGVILPIVYTYYYHKIKDKA